MTVAASVIPDSDGCDPRRAERFGARHVLWRVSQLQRVAYCGRVARSGGVAVRVDSGAGGRKAGYAGAQTCGSVWACPVCSAKIASARQGEIERALTRWHGAHGGRAALVTLTMRHRRGQALRDLWNGVSDAWQRATGGAGWKADQALYGVPMERVVKSGRRAGEVVIEPRLRTIRVVEVTDGENGWHVHVHALVLFGRDAHDGQVADVAAGMFNRWRSALVAAGFEAPSYRAGVDARLLRGDPSSALGEYFTKSVYSTSMEVARGDLKDARHGNRTPFSILRGLVEVIRTGDLGASRMPADVNRDLARWAEWEAGSRGRRQIAWTAGLKAELLPDEDEISDEEIVEQDQAGDVAAVMDAGTFRAITRARADWTVLEAFNRSTAEGLALLARYAAAVGGKVTTGPAGPGSPGRSLRSASGS